jgi:hypothetical protein
MVGDGDGYGWGNLGARIEKKSVQKYFQKYKKSQKLPLFLTFKSKFTILSSP